MNTAKIYQTNTKTKTKNLKPNFTEPTEYLISFLLNKLCIFSLMSPFGISYFAATYPAQKLSIGIIAAFLGIIFNSFGVSTFKYIGTLAVYLTFTLVFNQKLLEKKWVSASLAAISLFSVGLIFVIFDGFLIYDIMMLFLECIVTFISFFAFSRVSALVRSIKDVKIYDLTDIASIIFLISLIMLTILSVPYLEIVAYIICIYIILFAASSCGIGIAAVSGIIFGAVCSSASVLPNQIFFTYTISALCAGVLKKYGKIAVCGGFSFSALLCGIFLNGFGFSLYPVIYTLGAILLLLITPKHTLEAFSKMTSSQVTSFTGFNRQFTSDIVTEKLQRMSSSFTDVANAFSTLITKQVEEKITNPGLIFDATSEDICRKCENSIFCWTKNYNRTAEMLAETFESMSKRGYALEFDFPCEFRSECINFDDFIDSLNKNYEIHKNNLMWASKVHESRLLLSEQFRNISSVLKNIDAELSLDIEFDTKLAKKLAFELYRKNIKAENIQVYYDDCFKVTMKIPYKKYEYIDIIAATSGYVCGVPLFCSEHFLENEVYFLKFTENIKFSAEIGFAKVSATGEDICGDSHVFMPLPDGKYILALSDGMGRGKNALTQSKTTIELIKKLLYCGFEKETALRLINTILLMKSPGETFATADICILNMFSGAIEFIKTGASSSYIKNGKNLSEIKCSSLPIGAISSLSADCELKYVKNGDFIILMTDGISDILDSGAENTLREIIMLSQADSAQGLAEEIITAARNKMKNKPHDDMTVLVASINGK